MNNINNMSMSTIIDQIRDITNHYRFFIDFNGYFSIKKKLNYQQFTYPHTASISLYMVIRC